MIQIIPSLLAKLPPDAMFFWTDGQDWRVYQAQERWCDGVVVRCLHPDSTHAMMLSPQQWVPSLSTREEGRGASLSGWLAPWLGWQTSTLSVRVIGRSMTPSLPMGCTVELAPALGTIWRPGEIATWVDHSREGGPVWNTHRVVRVWQEEGGLRLLTRGDAARTLDPPLRREAILGRVVQAQLGAKRWDPSAPHARARAWMGWHALAWKHRIKRWRSC